MSNKSNIRLNDPDFDDRVGAVAKGIVLPLLMYSIAGMLIISLIAKLLDHLK